MLIGLGRIAIGLLAVAVTKLGFVNLPAVASKAVARTIVGGVAYGDFISSDGYHIRPRYPDGQKVDLLPFEEHKLTISSDLLPGDFLIVKEAPRNSGPCETK